MTGADERVAHWDAAYAGGHRRVSWFQDDPAESLDAIWRAAPAPDAPIVDVGGGASALAGRLLEQGRTDVTVLDLSAVALQLAGDRIGDDPRVHWIAADVLAWKPERTYAIWHDRALLHFFTADADRARYAATLAKALHPGGHAIVATFAPHGPERCSGLRVRRSAATEIAALLGPGFELQHAATHDHVTPGGTTQPFTWAILRRATAA